MESQSSEAKVEKSQDLSLKSSKGLGEMQVVDIEAKVEPSLGPITPDSNKENVDFPVDLSLPFTAVKHLPKRRMSFSDGEEDFGSPRTPKHGVFDPFAPGPDEMAMAPLCKKFVDELRANVARRLNFGSCIRNLADYSGSSEDLESLSDEEVFESLYENLLESIVSNLAEGAFAAKNPMQWDSDSYKTPTSAPRLTGVAETCPGAPTKLVGKSRIIDMGLCRKLEF